MSAPDSSLSAGRALPAVAVALVAAVAAAGPALAHDFWIEPSVFRPELVSTVRLSLKVGDHFEGRPVRRSSAHILDFDVAGPAGKRPVAGQEGRDPAGFVRIDQSGAFVVAYSSQANPIELPAERFERYLESEGLEHIVELRTERGETDQPGREAFTRYAKSLILAGGNRASGEDTDRFTIPVGLELELVPETDPYALDSGERLPLQLLHRSTPLAGALVVARHRGSPQEAIRARTDREGRVLLALDRPGDWLLTAVHMVEAATGSDAAQDTESTAVDWQSYWASLTFERPAASEAR